MDFISPNDEFKPDYVDILEMSIGVNAIRHEIEAIRDIYHNLSINYKIEQKKRICPVKN